MNFKNLKYDMTHIIQSLDHVFFKFITKDTVSWFIGPSQPFSDFCIQDQGNILKWVNWYYYLIAQICMNDIMPSVSFVQKFLILELCIYL